MQQRRHRGAAPPPGLGAAEFLRWRGAVDSRPEREQTADASPGECWPGEGEGDTGGRATRALEEGRTSGASDWGDNVPTAVGVFLSDWDVRREG